eukprot:m.486529 g.486529  ORF g.486529 m.486529 type:complete len:202 (-) comp24473_c0_seq1:38-643(-)
MSGEEALFQQTANIKHAVGILNGLEPARLPKLLQRILAKLHVQNGSAFTDEENEALQGALELSHDDLSLLLSTISFFFQTAAYNQLSPKAFSQQLLTTGLAEEQREFFGKAWAAKGAEVVGKLRDRSFFHTRLANVNWGLHVQVADSSRTKLAQPTAAFEFGLAKGAEGPPQNVHVEFTHQELFEFYNQLETVQAQLDQLS